MKNIRLIQRIIHCTVFIPVLFLTAHAAATEMQAGLNPFVVFFPRGSVELDQRSTDMIKDLAGRLDRDAVQQIVVEGYSDNMSLGPDRPYYDNLELSEARADNVAELLQKASGLPANLIKSIGRGAINPIGDNQTEEGRAANRRAEVWVTWRQSSSADLPAAVHKDTAPQPEPEQAASLISMSLNEVEIGAAFEMISRREHINIILDQGVSGTVSINLYDITTEQAILAIAESAGFAVREKYGGYIILPADIADGSEHDTTIRTFKVQYTDPAMVKDILNEHISKHGKITVLEDRNLVVIEDNPQALARMEQLLAEIDKEPRQILIEAKILEIKLSDDETWGLDWSYIFDSGDGTGSIELSGSASTEATGFIATLDRDDFLAVVNALSEKGRVRTLSTPKLLALENQQAEVIIGERQGYRVTTTINQVTTESVEFLESGVILTVTPSVDGQGRILMAIHPEVSTGTVQLGIPDKTTTEVTTVLLAEDGQPIFIGGLIRNTVDYKRSGIPLLGDIPYMGRLFSDIEEKKGITETVVLITPYLIKDARTGILDHERNKLNEQIESINESTRDLSDKISWPTP